MYNIALIGAGELGSRHLQGLKKAKIDMSIYVVDTNPISLKLSRQRYDQIEENPSINTIKFLNNLEDLPMDLDLVIISTSSAVRANITKELLNLKQTKNIVFEKFLFPSVSDYDFVSNLLEINNVNAWVNCPRRIFPFYKDLKVLLKNSKKLSYTVIGGEWGLACNSIHFIDNFAMLSGIQDFILDVSNLDNILLSSKRSGYIELTGTIEMSSINAMRFSLTSIINSIEPVILKIKTEDYEIIVKESQNEMDIIDNKGDKISKKIQMIFQSQLTGLIAENILQTGVCELTNFKESSKLHLQFLKPIVNFYNEISGKNGDYCPIT